jgi:Dyp-type peroxidase family
MQGLVLSAYPHLDRAQYLLFTIKNPAAARQWLTGLLPHITNAFKDQHPDGSLHDRGRRKVNVNIALTAQGLAKMVGGPAPPADLTEYLSAFSIPFLEGIHGRDHRSRILGNTGDDAPDKWQWGGPCSPAVHVLLMVFADGDEAALARAVAGVMPPEAAMMPAAVLQPSLPLSEAGGREHFGFADGLSQPVLAGSDDAQRFPDSVHITALGEFVFGYANQFGEPAAPSKDPRERFLHNGSYLVFCQFDQHVNRFWEYVDRATGAPGVPNPHAAEQLASKIVGRVPDGTPLVPYANLNDNEFDYTEDPYGYGCPIGAHVRRSNPRDTSDPSRRNRHRILRRGRSYGPRAKQPRAAVDGDRGLFFMCLNTDLERQFEFIQQNWTNNPAFSGLGSGDERDPLIGGQSCPVARGVFTVQGLPAPARLTEVPHFVTVKGGQYFFLPGLKALRALSNGECRVEPEVDAARVDDAASGINGLVKTLERHIEHDYTPPHYKRDAHPKMHGCVQAVLTVREGLDAHLRQGLFAHPGHYLAWVRFSNAFKIQHDLEFETRGMAIKLLDVEGPGRALGTLEGDADRRTQDFLFATYPAFFLPDMTVDYRAFAEATARGQLAVLTFFLRRWLIRGGWAALRSALVLARNPLAITYFSQTPYRFGDGGAVVKLRARPWMTPELRTSIASNLLFRSRAAAANVWLTIAQARGRVKTQAAEALIDQHVAPRDFLRHAMMKTLSEGDAKFEIEVQLQRTPIRAMPIDNATVRWPERRSRFEPVATLTIPRQVFWPEPGMPEPVQKATERMMALGENMSFNPWHALESHTPLGQINEARRRIYTDISTFRRHANVIDQPVPTAAQYLDLKQIVQDGLLRKPDRYENVAP